MSGIVSIAGNPPHPRMLPAGLPEMKSFLLNSIAGGNHIGQFVGDNEAVEERA
jgi:hypothetical protein